MALFGRTLVLRYMLRPRERRRPLVLVLDRSRQFKALIMQKHAMRSEGDHTTNLMLSCLRGRDDKLCSDAADEIEWLHEYIKKLERRIHNQRRANRETWEIVEKRRKWLGSDTARRHAMFYLAQFRKVRDQLNALTARR